MTVEQELTRALLEMKVAEALVAIRDSANVTDEEVLAAAKSVLED